MSLRFSSLTKARFGRAALRGLFAWLAVLLLIGGVSAGRIGASVLAAVCAYDHLALVVQSDSAADVAANLPLDDTSGDDALLRDAAAQLVPLIRAAVRLDAAAAFDLPLGALRRAHRPTGPPAELTL